MSEYPVSLLRRFRGGGLIQDDPLVTTATDASGNPYVASDYEGSYLIPVKIRDLSTFLRVKKWKITVTCDVTFGANSTTYTSSTIKTPDTVYEIVRGFYDENDSDPPNDVDWSRSLHEVPNENYHELDRGKGSARSRPFRGLSISGDISLDRGWGVSISPARGYQSFDYYRKSSNFSDLEDGINAKPTDEIYLPVAVDFSYLDDSGLPSISLFAYTKISDTSMDADKDDLNVFSNAFRLKFLGVDFKANMYWIEPTGEGITLDDLDVTMEAAEYWTYGGKFDSTTGEPT